METEVLPDSVSQHPLVSLISACFWVIREYCCYYCSFTLSRFLMLPSIVWLLSWIRSFAAFVTITMPRFVYAILSYSMTLTVGPQYNLGLCWFDCFAPLLARFLEFCRYLFPISYCTELLHPVSVSEWLYTIEGASIGEAGRKWTASGCEHWWVESFSITLHGVKTQSFVLVL